MEDYDDLFVESELRPVPKTPTWSATSNATSAPSSASAPPLSASSSSASASATPNKKSKIVDTTITEAHHVVVCLGEGRVHDWWSEVDDPAVVSRLVMYNAFPGDGTEPHFFFGQTVLPTERGVMYEMSTRHSSVPEAIRDHIIIPVKLHGKGVPSTGEYVELPKLKSEEIEGAPVMNGMYAFIAQLAATPTKQSISKDGRSFDITTMLVHMLDDEDNVHLAKIKMWGSAPAEARKGLLLRAIGLTKSAFRDDVSFDAHKFTAIVWGYKDPKNRPNACHAAKLKRAVAKEENDEDVDVREVEVLMHPGAPRWSTPTTSSAKSASSSSSSAKKARAAATDEDEDDIQVTVEETKAPVSLSAPVASSSSSSASKKATKKKKKLVADDEAEEDEF